LLLDLYDTGPSDDLIIEINRYEIERFCRYGLPVFKLMIIQCSDISNQVISSILDCIEFNLIITFK